MNLPSSAECLNFFSIYHVPSNIKKHCLTVNRVATFMAKEIAAAGVSINLNLVRCSALIHDLFKVVVIDQLEPSQQYHPEPYTRQELAMWQELRKKYPNRYESEVAYEEFKDIYPELAQTVKNLSDPTNLNKTWEELIVHYADWRISGESIQSLNERLIYLRARYPHSDWDTYAEIIKKDEQKLFTKLSFLPEELKQKFEETKI